jgi:hypothetical protein
VEETGIGSGFVQNLRQRRMTIKSIPAQRSKIDRTDTAQIRMSCGMIYFMQDAPWLPDFLSELEQFPFSRYKDQVDCLAHGAAHVNRRWGSPPLPQDQAAKQEAEFVQKYKEVVEVSQQKKEEKDEMKAQIERSIWAGFGDDDE